MEDYCAICYFFQDDIQLTAQRIEQSNVPDDVFHAVADNAVQVYGNGRNAEELLNELCGNEGLAKVSCLAMRLSAFASWVYYWLKKLVVEVPPFWGVKNGLSNIVFLTG